MMTILVPKLTSYRWIARAVRLCQGAIACKPPANRDRSDWQNLHSFLASAGGRTSELNAFVDRAGGG